MALTYLPPGVSTDASSALRRLLGTLVPPESYRMAHYRKGDVIYRAGESGRKIYFIQKGRVALLMDTEDGDLIEAEDPGTGHVLGAEALLQKPFDATAQALSVTSLLVCDVAIFLDSLGNTPAAIRNLLVDLIGEVHELRLRYLRIATQSSLQRLAGHILMHASRGPLGDFLPLPWGSKTHLARHLTLRQETLSRTLDELKHRGIIRDCRGGILVLDRDKLQNVCG